MVNKRYYRAILGRKTIYEPFYRSWAQPKSMKCGIGLLPLHASTRLTLHSKESLKLRQRTVGETLTL